MDFFVFDEFIGGVDGDANKIIFISFYILVREWHMLLHVRKKEKN